MFYTGQAEARVIPFEIEKIKQHQHIPHALNHEIESIVSGINLDLPNFSRIKQILLESNALLKGHFRLRSGGHSSWFLQFARVAQRYENINFIAQLLANRFTTQIDTILSPNTAGTLLGIRIAHLLKCRFIQCSLDKGEAELRPGFEIDNEERILAVNDIVTTGSGIRALRALGSRGRLVGLATFSCRYPAHYQTLQREFDVPFEALVELEVDYFDVQHGSECPLPEPYINAEELY